MDADATATLHKKGVAATVDSFKFTWFQEHSNVIKVIYTGSEFLESVIPGEEVGIILETTTFYAEQGGQKYDTGLLEGPDGVFEVSNVQIYGTHITNTRDAKALALLSEEGIAKGICRVTAVTMDCAFKAVELAASLEQEVNEASKTEGSILEQKVTYLNNRVEGASIPSAKKADLNAKISALQSQVIKAKKEISEENIQKAIKVATQMAEVAFSNGKDYCVSHVNVGSDTAAIREAVVKVMEQKGMSIMVFSKDETVNKAFVCAGVPEQDGKYKQLNATEWLKKVLDPISGKGGGGKGGLAQGQGSDVSRIEIAIDVAESFAAMKLT